MPAVITAASPDDEGDGSEEDEMHERKRKKSVCALFFCLFLLYLTSLLCYIGSH